LKKQLSDVQTELSQVNAEILRREDEASQLEEELQAC
jgi:septal ring factor EnvC (AmiA/AmiB activator)